MNYNQNTSYQAGGEEMTHVHELQGIVMLADPMGPHQHRFSTVTGEARASGTCEHVHEVEFRTDTFDNHHHMFRGVTGCSIPAGDRHIHYIASATSVDDGHSHIFYAATMIENPSGYNLRTGESGSEGRGFGGSGTEESPTGNMPGNDYMGGGVYY